MTLATEAVDLAEELVDRGVKATADVRSTGGKACVLVSPPVRNYPSRSTEWTLVALAGRSAADLDTFKILAGLVATVEAAVPLTTSRPGFYQLTSDQPPVPAYLMTFTAGMEQNR